MAKKIKELEARGHLYEIEPTTQNIIEHPILRIQDSYTTQGAKVPGYRRITIAQIPSVGKVNKDLIIDTIHSDKVKDLPQLHINAPMEQTIIMVTFNDIPRVFSSDKKELELWKAR